MHFVSFGANVCVHFESFLVYIYMYVHIRIYIYTHTYMKLKITQSYLILCDPMDYTVQGILQA